MSFLDASADTWSAITGGVDRDAIVVLGLVEAIARIWKRTHEQALAGYDLNLAEWTTIGMLRSSPPDFRRSPTELRRLVGQTSAGMTRILKKLGDRGLVRRRPNSADGRGQDVISRGRRRKQSLEHATNATPFAAERESPPHEPCPGSSRVSTSCGWRSPLPAVIEGVVHPFVHLLVRKPWTAWTQWDKNVLPTNANTRGWTRQTGSGTFFAKVRVAGSNPVVRSKKPLRMQGFVMFSESRGVRVGHDLAMACP